MMETRGEKQRPTEMGVNQKAFPTGWKLRPNNNAMDSRKNGTRKCPIVHSKVAYDCRHNATDSSLGNNLGKRDQRLLYYDGDNRSECSILSCHDLKITCLGDNQENSQGSIDGQFT